MINANKTSVLILFFFILISQQSLGQLSDDFSDGDFTSLPAWSGTTSDFLVNASHQLQLNNTVAATSYLSAPNAQTLGDNEWRFFVKQNFAGSATNFGRVYLVSNQQNLTSPLNGYYLQFGEALNNDAVELFKQTGTTTSSICRAANGTIAANFNIRVKVTRNSSGVWEIFIDYLGGANFIFQATGTDNTYSSSSFFGLRCTYSITNAKQFFYDDFQITTTPAPDLTAPTISATNLISSNEVEVQFSETVNSGIAQDVSNYSLAPSSTHPATATLQSDLKTVRLQYAQSFTNGVSQTLAVKNVTDLASNIMSATNVSFMFFQPVPPQNRDIIITEIFADPSPQIGLPEAEFVELFNRSANPFDLTGWKFTDGTSIGMLSSKILLPGDYLILSTTSANASLSTFGKAMGLSPWPSLNNSGDALVLKDPQGRTIDSVKYESAWYKDNDKKDGGWSLELIDTENFCRGSANWIASTNPLGGTPGSQNSVYAITPDTTGPKLLSVTANDLKSITLTFDERLSNVKPSINKFTVSPSTLISSVAFDDESLTKIKLSFSEDVDLTATYTISVQDIFDCPGNLVQQNFSSLTLKLDNTLPTIISTTATTSTEVMVLFSEKMNKSLAENILNYQIDNQQNPQSAILQQDQVTVKLTFFQSFANGSDNVITTVNITDLAGNQLQGSQNHFIFFQPVPSQNRDIIITEIFADPSPQIGLPEAEFVELFNRSASPFDLTGWKFTDGTSIGMLSSKILLPGEYLILSSTSANASFSTFGKAMGLTPWPSLNNSGDALFLKDPQGKTIDSVKYESAWYKDNDKKDGGWSLELIDTENFCRGSENWTASTNTLGGSPGSQNSVYTITPDMTGPKLLSATADDLKSITLTFDERLINVNPSVNKFTISPATLISSVAFDDESLTKIKLSFSEDVDLTATYTIAVQDIFDCPGNLVQQNFSSLTLKLDNTLPTIISTTVNSATELSVLFSEKMTRSLAENTLNYQIDNQQNPQSAILQQDQVTVKLLFLQPLQNGVDKVMTTIGLTDLAGNQLQASQNHFIFFQPVPPQNRDIIITEIFADPSPQLGLPEAEFVEVFNRSASPFDLTGWKFTDGTSIGILSSKILLPGEYLILSTTSANTSFSIFGKTMGLSPWPSLNNSGDALVLKDPHGKTIDSVRYESAWYKDNDKKDGGWSLELIDTENFCRGSANWIASTNTLGGTPGLQNSVYAITPDIQGPKLLSVKTENSKAIILQFNEPLNALMPGIENFIVQPTTEIEAIKFADGSLDKINIAFLTDLDSTFTFKITAHVFDCTGNEIQPEFLSQSFRLDATLPEMESVKVLSPSELLIVFSEKLNVSSAENISNYQTQILENPSTAILQSDFRSVRLVFGKPFVNGVEQSLTVKNITDRTGNFMLPAEKHFMYFQASAANFKDIIISEIMADPSPSIGLPEAEFVELFNRSNIPYDLKGWTFSDGSSVATFFSHILLPDEYIIICASTQVAKFVSLGTTIGATTFPSLNNTGESLVLKNLEGKIIDSVYYADTWYKDSEKKDGGWSLELIDPENTCAEADNWIASENEKGGTPGKQNSVLENKPDLTGPVLLSIIALDPSTLLVEFNEKLENKTPQSDNFSIEPLIHIDNVLFASKSLTSFYVTLTEPLEGGKKYSMSVQYIYDCASNLLQEQFDQKDFALPGKADSLDLVVNEVLFNPRPTGVDFVELVNRSEKYVNLKNWKLASLDGETLKNIKTITEKDFLLEPGSYIVFAENGNVLKGEYVQSKEETFFEMHLPSLPDDEGSIVLMDDSNRIIDSFFYSAKFHSVFIVDDEGISIERISVQVNTNDPQNWKSASSNSGFATPGYLNSNSGFDGISNESVAADPEIFMPVFGQPDFTHIKYSFDHGGYIANIKIFDPQGRQVKVIANNQLLGTEGFFRWDGDMDNGSKAGIGSYMIWFEIFDERGIVKTIRKRVAVAGKF